VSDRLSKLAANSSSPPWSPVHIARLVELWNLGRTATEILELIPGKSRNAIIGKLSRLRRQANRGGLKQLTQFAMRKTLAVRVVAMK
jgi:hypothetical protein